MPETRILTEYGMGASLRRQDYTQAAKRAIRNALWRNSINAAELFGFEKSAMILDVEIGVQQPDLLDHAAIAAEFPYGQPRIHPVQGGLDIPRPDARPTVIANVAITVSFVMERV